MAEFTKDYLNALVALRHQLHKEPEVAHEEQFTSAIIADFLKHFTPDALITGLGGNGLAAVFKGKKKGPVVLFRCELDGLPINESNDVSYRSTKEGKGHLCGHDGHMAIVSGLAPLLSANRPEKGTVVLLYQPAEETGEGARLVMKDKRFSALKIEYVFALHNLPGFGKSTVIVRNGIFASASKGLIVTLKGTSSHAGHPEDGKNPSLAASMIIQALLSLPSTVTSLRENAMVTPIHTRIGGPAFGTSPGEGVVMFTLRAHSNETMDLLMKEAVTTAERIASAHGIAPGIERTEPFDAVNNDEACVGLITEVARSLDLKVTEQPDPFPWSEDFGVFTGAHRGALFGLGAGARHHQLHNERYDFPDELIEPGVKMFYGIADRLLNSNT
jgi:amidohydrolase